MDNIRKTSLLDYRRFLFSEMGRAKNLDAVIDIFIKNIGLFNNVDIVYVNKGESNDLAVPMNLDFSFSKGVLQSNFESDALFLLNADSVSLAHVQKDYRFGTLYDISLDTQIISYIDRHSRGISDSKEINQVVNEITKKRKFASAMNPSPYLLENGLKDGTVSKDSFRSTFNFFKVLYTSHSKFRITATISAYLQTRLLAFSYKKMLKNHRLDIFHDRFKIVYVVLMKMYTISIKNKSYEKKVIELLEYCNNELHRMPIAELILSFEFFKKGTKLLFFSKFQKNHKNMLNVIRNSSWDIFHLRVLDIYMTNVRHKKARLTLPFFFSVDKRLNDIAKLIKFKMAVVDYNTNQTHAFFSNNIVWDAVTKFKLEKYFAFKNHQQRINQSVNVNQLIENMEQEIEILER
ncbi:hypothetical protein KQ51_01553 [Candidatus Izimaplasma bacterium HR1]|jgi:hypothetical protein|uniref:hypothetical protein n=1 Tax=Candidatus Izimoplasma sp. HR1 TaxID=1541959 RepID=UPI0004F6B52A|nr:hypothetical protein KQ51_01553 [Candidatus Izimaplasma bacterium HR1]